MSQIMEKTLASLPKLLTQSLIGGKSAKPSSRQQPSQDVQNFMKVVHRVRYKSSHEAAIVNAELSNIQQKLKQSDLTAAAGIVRNSFTKAVFCHLLGYDVTFVAIYAVNLAQQGRGYDKRLGYLLSCLLLHPNHEMVMLMQATLLRDLKSSSMGDNCIALLVAGELVGEENIPSILPEVVKKLRHSHELVREKALHCLRTFYQRAPSMLLPTLPQLNTFLTSRDPGVLMATTNIFLILTAENPSKYTGLGPSFLHILHQINNRGFGTNYYYHMVPLPWLQINLLKILGNLGSEDPQLRDAATPALQTLIEKTKVTEPISLAVLVESVLTATKISASEQLLHLCSRCIGKLLSSDASNAMKYQGLGLLISLSRVKSSYAAQHQMAVVECLNDEDPAIQARTAHLLHAMANRANVRAICSKLFEQINRTSEKVLINEILMMISDLAERLTVDIDWYMETYLSILELKLEPEMRDTYIDLALKRIEKFSRKPETVPDDSLCKLITMLLQVLNKRETTQPVMMLSLQLLGVLAPIIGHRLPVDMFLSYAEKLLLSPDAHCSIQKNYVMIKAPMPSSDRDLESSQDEDLTNLQNTCIITISKFIISGCLDTQTVKDWLEKDNYKQRIKPASVHISFTELQELLEHPDDLPMRSQIMFRPYEAQIDLSLSFLDQLVVQDLLQGQEGFVPKYVKLAEEAGNASLMSPVSDTSVDAKNLSGTDLLQASNLDTSKASSSGSFKMSKSVQKVRNKWRDDGEDTDESSEQFLIVDGDGAEYTSVQEERKRKEGLAKELFAGLDIVERSELSGFSSEKKKLTNMWDDDDDEEENSNTGHSLTLHPFGISRKTKMHNQSSRWQDEDIENDNLSLGLDNYEHAFISSKCEKAESPSGYMSPFSGEFDMASSATYSMLGPPGRLHTDETGALYNTALASSYPSAQQAHPSLSSPLGKGTAPSIYSDNSGIYDLGELNAGMGSSGNMSVSTVDALTDSDPEEASV